MDSMDTFIVPQPTDTHADTDSDATERAGNDAALDADVDAAEGAHGDPETDAVLSTKQMSTQCCLRRRCATLATDSETDNASDEDRDDTEHARGDSSGDSREPPTK